ncbi:hypothetical protein SCALIN_C13_0249 [Candidatus Scalindua japonica]|uniref:Putative restriction endonuclease domain-containing protein n=1 Tax=Candidatus Scalindua japonica TaxID=1284222 RepID=A0A286TXX1_9BACT|nr:Uma2 family endonuclease [Candidatus Scalindua japonica]GAX60732.1 hypothetical protein SCALIN_C13_0249 [Candidatus Scalindua japonica]
MRTLLEDKEKKVYTYKDYLTTPGDKRYELIEGELIMNPSPVTYHQWISRKIGFELEKFVEKKKLGYVFNAPLDVYFDDTNLLQPDIFFIAINRLGIIAEKNIQGAPDLTIEILSEATAYKDFVKKKKIYAKYGVKEYWIVDPVERTIDLYTLKETAFVPAKSFTKNEIFESVLLHGFTMNLENIFASWK